MLTAFTAGLLLISLSELGDKTFFIAVILSMRYPRRLVFTGVVAALASMTIIAVVMGRVVAFLPEIYLHWATISLFGLFGIKLLYQASKMPSSQSCGEEEEEARKAVAASNLAKNKSKLRILLEAFTLTFLAEWGDRTQIATIALAATYHPVGVISGVILGHSISTAIAVLGGRIIAGRISERTITAVSGCLFIVFGLVALINGVENVSV
ncbi:MULTISPECIES: TMEM165/GDT1 family protein [Limnospira]|uniref:TMEM165/GDT1 family protein n=1 Tax=Limnospira TaxID=2596745 RepID=UPI0028E15A40|nr:TMEM165/GDT1 family protein [Limnospira sp. PMC 917.15]MDT9233305.1 TMEM165/GDT1 family protein [Limnospira sp. PMC 917.15]MDY7052465.1 TMEM165/GDT1 family protein [Limnospira fusiformis LS22]